MSWSCARNAGDTQADEAKKRAKWLMRQAEQTNQQTVFLLNLLNEHRLEIEARDAVMCESSKLVAKLQAENESLKQQLQELQQAVSITPGAASSAMSAVAQPRRQRSDPRHVAGDEVSTDGTEGSAGLRPALLACTARVGSPNGVCEGFEPGASPRTTSSLFHEARAKLRMTSDAAAVKESQPEPPQPLPQLMSAASLAASEPLAPPTPQPSLRLSAPTAQAQEQVVRAAVEACSKSEAHPVSGGGHALSSLEALVRPAPPSPQPAHKPQAQPQPQPESSLRQCTKPHLLPEGPLSAPRPRGLQSQPSEPPQPAEAHLRIGQTTADPPQLPLAQPSQPQIMRAPSLQPPPQAGPPTPVPVASSEQQQRLEARCKSLSAEVDALRKQAAAAQREVAVATSNYLTCKKDLDIMTRKYDSLMLQKLEAEEQRDRLFCPQLDLSLVRQAMPVVDAALSDAEERLRTVVEMLASTQEDAEEAARMHFEQRRKWVEKLDELHAQLVDREARLAQLEVLQPKT